ncbi:MAG: hypothetical protein JOZ62_21280 [Acidobacteriaceae bacterium]|nr:hypothetical protein [Acidobacteriaceae bacterium]
MSAAPATTALPLSQQANKYWEQFTNEFRRQVQAMNAALSKDGCAECNLLQWEDSNAIYITKTGYPSTSIRAYLTFHPWGPAIQGTINGQQAPDRRFFPAEFEFPIATDLDGETVAIFDEGRSFSPHEVASYLAQAFHRCYPGVSLPC